METTALDVFEAASGRLAALKARHNLLVQATKEVLVEGLDFGKIPGTGDKPTLLKPGAEKLCYLFGLRPTFEVVEAREDWTGGLFYYRYRCTLHDQSGNVLADGEGSCNSREKKYRYRQSERVCPKCGKPTIIKGKEEYGGGWLCYAKKGGCGAKFADNAPEITSQPSGLVENTEPYDLVNTIQKMAQKRALVAAVLVGAGASQFFTQDVEDMSIIDVPFEVTKSAPAQVVEAPAEPEPQAHWIDDVSTRSKFWKWATDNGLGLDDVHEALGCDIHDFTGDKRAAIEKIEAWIDAHTTAEPEPEPAEEF